MDPGSFLGGEKLFPTEVNVFVRGAFWAPLLVTVVPPYDLVQMYERVSYWSTDGKPAKITFRGPDTGGKRANTRMKMEVLARSCRHKQNDISTSFQPIWMKQKATTRSRSNEQVVTVNLLEVLTSKPFVFTY